MRILFKIIAAPVVAILSVLCAVLSFLFCRIVILLEILSGVIFLIALIGLFMKPDKTLIPMYIVAFLISPFGIPAIAGWLIDKLGDLNDTLKDFITS